MNDLKEELVDMLTLADPGLIGCHRRTRWDRGKHVVWRNIRGNALMALAGHKGVVETPVGELEFYYRQDQLMFFRGGEFNGYWLDDFIDVWSIVSHYGEPLSRDTILFHENKGVFTPIIISIPEKIDAEERALEIVEGFGETPPRRIPKNDARALRVCKFCPVRVRCNAQDTLDGSTSDWSPSYQRSLR